MGSGNDDHRASTSAQLARTLAIGIYPHSQDWRDDCGRRIETSFQSPGLWRDHTSQRETQHQERKPSLLWAWSPFRLEVVSMGNFYTRDAPKFATAEHHWCGRSRPLWHLSFFRPPEIARMRHFWREPIERYVSHIRWECHLPPFDKPFCNSSIAEYTRAVMRGRHMVLRSWQSSNANAFWWLVGRLIRLAMFWAWYLQADWLPESGTNPTENCNSEYCFPLSRVGAFRGYG